MSTKSKIITIPNQKLRRKALAVEKIDEQVSRGLLKMRDELIASNGVGLAAPQIGWNRQIFATNLSKINPPDENKVDKNLILFFFNPKIVKCAPDKVIETDDEGNETLEGCLSLPGLFSPVPRYPWVEVEFETLSLDGREQCLIEGGGAISWPEKLVTQKTLFKDYFARNVQHEMDHLIGRLFTDYLKNTDLPLYRDNPDTHQLEEIENKDLIINSY